MVNNRGNLSAYSGLPPTSAQASRDIAGGPLYQPAEVRALLEKGEAAIVPWTRKCKNDLLRLSLDLTDAQALVREALQQGRFRNSEWCEQQPNGPWAACDAYQLLRKEWVKAAYKEMAFEYYVKFAIGKTGKLLLLVSCHEPQERDKS